MNRTTSVVVLVAVLSLGIAGGVGLQKAVGARETALSSQDRPEATPAAKQLQESFNKAAEYATRSVVHITTESAPPAADEWWTQAQQNIGSGVVVSADGHVVTNDHVIRGSKSRVVRFSDGREFRASVVGSDPDSDLAVLKLEGGGAKFQPLEFADSDKVRVGDWVLAIGSPFGYNNSVSAGIVSAKHRVANVDQPYQDFIQTDAAINPGNSGGALVDLSGRVVGINAAIVSNTRAFEGIGLAISANLTKWVVERLMRDGKVKRGYLGIMPYDLNAELVTMLRQDGIRSVDDLLADVGLESARGVFIVRVPDGPAAKAGVRAGDVIVEIDGRAVPHKQELFFMIAQLEPGRTVKVKLLRDRKAKEVDVEIAERPPTPRRR